MVRTSSTVQLLNKTKMAADITKQEMSFSTVKGTQRKAPVKRATRGSALRIALSSRWVNREAIKT